MDKKTNYITPKGYQKLLEELHNLTTAERPKVVQQVAEAAAMGDRSENAEYIYGKRRLREIDRRMRFLRSRLDAANVVDPREDRGQIVFFGATVVVEDVDSGQELVYQLVGADETDGARGKISYLSPVGKALMGRTVDDELRIETPNGSRELVIIQVRYC